MDQSLGEGGIQSPSSLITGLVADLASSASGVSFVYRTLEGLAKRWALKDAVLILEDPRAGRQIFRRGRRDPRNSSALVNPLQAPPGLYLDPPQSPLELSGVAELCQLGLELDFRRRDASRDPLTGLLNRRSFEELFAKAVGQSARYGWPFALVLVDLDGFKAVNDRLGHQGGDRMMALIGGLLRSASRSGDVAARVGGDEFALIVANAGAEAVNALLERVRRALKESVGEQLDFSAGVAFCPAESTDQDILFQLADRRLYEAKGGRRS
jgi:diguanylate cyclase (GGDEF)-like protein